MIFEPFTVISRGKRRRIIDREYTSDLDLKVQIKTHIFELLRKSDQRAVCEAIASLNDPETLAPQAFAVVDDASGVFEGIWLQTCFDIIEWDIDGPNPSVDLDARPSPGLITFPVDEEADFAVEAVLEFLSGRLRTVDGIKVNFRRMSWAIFTDRDDEIGARANALHARASNDDRLNVTTTLDPDVPGRTFAVLEPA